MVREHGGTHGVLAAKRLEAILGRAEQYAHDPTDADVFDLTALYLEGIAHDHPFLMCRSAPIAMSERADRHRANP